MINIEEIPGLETELQMVNRHMERFCRSDSESMQKVLDWVLNARGKQIRPILTLLCARLKGKAVDATEVAAVIELCHTASLIHDDIIDDADTRRGQLSVQKKFGKEMAVYAGDFMIFSIIRRSGLKNKPWYGLMFEKLETMCDGEVSQFDNRYNTEITEEKYLENIRGKTSAMFRIACGSGACEGKCNGSEVLAVEQFAEKFGLLFQLRDDLLDFVFTDDLAKKTVQNDFWCGYYTLPAIHTFSDSRNGAELKQIAKDIKNGLHSEATDRKIAELISDSDGFGYTLMRIDQYAREAKQSLKVLQDSVARKKLQELVDTVQLSAHRIVSGHLPAVTGKTGHVCEKKDHSFWPMVMIFFAMSLTGWVWEVCLHLISDRRFVNRGFLHGPWLPIYGFGSILILTLLHKLRRKPWLEFPAIILLCGGMEYYISWFLEQLYDGMRWWDYSDYFLNLNGRICVEGLLAFGFGGMVIVYFYAPFLDHLFRCIPKKVLASVCLVLILLFCADLIYSGQNPNLGNGIARCCQ